MTKPAYELNSHHELDPNILKLNPKNPRIIRSHKFDLLVKSLRDDPQMLKARPIVVDPNLMVLGGNMRLKAARVAELNPVPVYIAGWDEVQQRRFIIKDNSSFGEWDWDVLCNDFDADELQEWGVDVPDFEPEEKPEAEDDNFEVPEEVQTDIQLGDRFAIGPHRLICADSTLTETFETLLPDEWANAVVTDPPYNVDYTTDNHAKIANDNMSDASFLAFLLDAFKAMNNRVKMGGAWYIWHADSEGLNFRRAMKEAGILQKQTLVWVKSSFTLGRQDYQWQHEPCLYGWKPGAAHYFTEQRSLSTIHEDPPVELDKMNKAELKELLAKMLGTHTSVTKHDKPKRNDKHPTMKPIPLVGEHIANSTQPGEIVLDGFLGSGSTMVAAHQLGRRCYGAEMDPKYCQIIIDRMRELDPTLEVTKLNA